MSYFVFFCGPYDARKNSIFNCEKSYDLFCTEMKHVAVGTSSLTKAKQYPRQTISWLQLHSTQFAVFRTICFDLWLSSFRLATLSSFELNRARCMSCTKEMGGLVCMSVRVGGESERGKEAKKRLGVLAQTYTEIQLFFGFRCTVYKRAVDDVTSTTIFFCFSNVEAFYTYR